MDDHALAARLDQLAAALADGGQPGEELAALMPVEPVSGPVVVACWRTDEALRYDVVSLHDGSSVAAAAAVREALALLAMVEALEEALAPEVLAPLALDLERWQPEGVADDPGLPALRAELQAVATRLHELAAAHGEGPRMATVQLLEQASAELRALEHDSELLTRAAETWTDAVGTAAPSVAELWRMLAALRHGPLLQPATERVRQGREAGLALARVVLEDG